MRLGYNDIYSSPFKVPFDAFLVSLRLGGGASISEASVRGRLYGRFRGGQDGERRTEFLVAQAYDYQKNGIFEYGGQSIVAGLSHLFRPSPSTQVAVAGVGGPILLGAIRSALVTGTPSPDPEGEPRTYDFGPGAELAASAALRVKGIPVVRFVYGGFYLRTLSAVEGEIGQHYAQVTRVDLLLPLWRTFRVGLSTDYINRNTYYETIPDVHQSFPRFSVFLSKVSR